MKKTVEVFDCGEYDKLWADSRTVAALNEIDKLSKKMKLRYAIIGGSAAYLYVSNPPPPDDPDVDILLDDTPQRSIAFIETLSKKPNFKLDVFDVDEDVAPDEQVVFSRLSYGKDVKLDIFTSLDAKLPAKLPRRRSFCVEPIEPLIIEKLIRASADDMRMVVSLLAYAKYDSGLLKVLAKERNSEYTLRKATFLARKIKDGEYSTKRQIDAAILFLMR